MGEPTFVRYSPEVEREELTFEESLQRIVASIKQSVAASIEEEGIGRAVRGAHAKGLARAEFEVLAGLPPAYRQAVYAVPGRHEALIRFSSARRMLRPIESWAELRVGREDLGIDGPTLVKDEPDSRTMDYAIINARSSSRARSGATSTMRWVRCS
jgi:hypothetical protein